LSLSLRLIVLPVLFLTLAALCPQAAAISPHDHSSSLPAVFEGEGGRLIPHRVLILNSYHPGMGFSDKEMEGIRSTLPPQTEIAIEYMDTKRVQGEPYLTRLAEIYALKYSTVRFDIIFSLDDDALHFLLRHGDRIFGDTPVVFCGVNNLEPGMLDHRRNFTGVLESTDIKASLDFALRLLPDTRTIAVVTDPTTTGAANRRFLEQLAASGQFRQPLVFLDPEGTGLQLPQLLSAVQGLKPDTLLYHADFHVDKQGNIIHFATLMPLLAQTAPCPVFVHNAMYMGLGALGGKLKSGFDQGAAAGALAQKIWNGATPADIAVVAENTNRFTVDYRQLQRWRIPTQTVVSAAGVPQQDIVVVNQAKPFWSGHGKYVLAGLGFILLEGALIALLILLFLRQRQLRHVSRQAANRFRALFDMAPFACVVNDQQGRYLMVNQAFCHITGMTAEQVLGRTSREAGVILEKEAVRSLKQQLNEQGRVAGQDITITIPPNTVLQVLQASVRIDWDGEPVIMSATADITGIREVEQALRDSEERYRELVQSASIIILKFDTRGRLTFVNEYALDFFGYSEEELLGKHLIGTIVPEIDSSGNQLQPMMQAICEGTESLADNINENITHTGERVWIHWRNRSIRDADGRIIEVLSFGTDITKRKLAEDEREMLQGRLLQAQKMESVGRLAGGVAHDFNNMLGVIIGHAEMVQDSLGPDHKFAHNVEQILTAAQRSADLTRQLLAFARKQPIAPKVLDLNHTITVMLAMLRRIIGENIELGWQPGEHLWPVLLDPTQATQILANLCINARDAISENGCIVIATANVTLDTEACAAHLGSIPGQYVQITVSDNGCGMDAATRDRVFDPFFTTKELGKGTGLGLPMVSGIISQNNGFIHLVSEPGVGTTFRLFLPRHLGDGANEQSPLPATASIRGKDTILLVEDEQILLDMSTIMLESLGYTVLSTMSAVEALRLAREYQGDIDLLITDVIMPEMNGKELAEQIRHLRPDLRILFISGYTADVIACDQSHHFLEKPFTKTTLGTKVRDVLSISPSSGAPLV
jgi:PAS domain S-box-containing protein